MNENEYIDKIQRIRHDNNVLWMDLLRIAFEYAPEETKKIFKEITENDRKINELSNELCEK